MKEAEKRLKENPGKYVDHIYGKDEAGGTSWIYLSAVPFEQLGFNTKIPAVKLPNLTWNMLSEIPFKVGALVVGLSLIAAFRNRGSDAKSRLKPNTRRRNSHGNELYRFSHYRRRQQVSRRFWRWSLSALPPRPSTGSRSGSAHRRT